MNIERDAAGTATKIEMRKPADMHQHFRAPRSAAFKLVTQYVQPRFGMAVAMPNLDPPVTSYEMMETYFRSLNEALGDACTPLMTLYLTDTLTAREVEECCRHPNFIGIKYYPGSKPGAELTTGSARGVGDPEVLWTPDTNPFEVLRVLAEHKKVLLMHGADGFARSTVRIDDSNYSAGEELSPDHQEQHFMRESLPRIIDTHPWLKKSVEHLSTKEGAEFIERNGGELLGCSLTYHHLALDDRDLFRGGFHPHRSWAPKIQKKEDRGALQRLASAGHDFVWLGSDSAPHAREKKEAACCANGVMTAHAGVELYVEAFEDLEMLEKLEAFASENGPRFFGLEPSSEQVTFERKEWIVRGPLMAWTEWQTPTSGGMQIETFVPFRQGEVVQWKLIP